ncbi:hypothetical protein SAMN05216388_10654 [Halorientalis persicus]|uniref:Uncharacterized protein n=1 Tax=Halorientalis persicus TaxID=1367881 RepID=A0A1H8WNR0_9EURY|nr:hypothetical protein SAMN05216388_10654 [Halorientalis persicus]
MTLTKKLGIHVIRSCLQSKWMTVLLKTFDGEISAQSQKLSNLQQN